VLNLCSEPSATVVTHAGAPHARAEPLKRTLADGTTAVGVGMDWARI